MPKPEEGNPTPEEVKVEETPKPVEEEKLDVVIEDETPKETPPAKVEERPKPTPESYESIKNKLYAQDRIISRLQREWEEKRPTPPTVKEEETPVAMDRIDKLAQTDWKAAVIELSKEGAKELIAKERQLLQQEREIQEINQIREKEAEFVIGRHPELNEADSEKSQIFQKILNDNPRWRTSPDGPRLTMREMEDELRARGYEVATPKREPESKPRSMDTILPPSRQTTPSNRVVLTREQRDFCDANGMKYEDYAKTLKQPGNNMEVSL